MPRITAAVAVLAVARATASMRPGRNAPDNSDDLQKATHLGRFNEAGAKCPG